MIVIKSRLYYAYPENAYRSMTNTIHTEEARQNMIHQQIRTWDVEDERVLSALSFIPRERFVPPAYRALAFADMDIPTASEDVCILRPMLMGRLLQALAIQPTDIVLDVGTGSGYAAAVLSVLARKVISMADTPLDAAAAKSTLESLNVESVEFTIHSNSLNAPERSLYDVIWLSKYWSKFPEDLKIQLRRGGRMIGLIGEKYLQAVLLTHLQDGSFKTQVLFETQRPTQAHTATHFIF